MFKLEDNAEFGRLVSFLANKGRTTGWLVCPSKKLEVLIIDTLIKMFTKSGSSHRVTSLRVPPGTRDIYEYLGWAPRVSRNSMFLTGVEDSINRQYQNMTRLNNPPTYQCAININNNYSEMNRVGCPMLLVVGLEGEKILHEHASQFVDYCDGTKFAFHLIEKDGKQTLSTRSDGVEGVWCQTCQKYH